MEIQRVPEAASRRGENPSARHASPKSLRPPNGPRSGRAGHPPGLAIRLRTRLGLSPTGPKCYAMLRFSPFWRVPCELCRGPEYPGALRRRRGHGGGEEPPPPGKQRKGTALRGGKPPMGRAPHSPIPTSLPKGAAFRGPAGSGGRKTIPRLPQRRFESSFALRAKSCFTLAPHAQGRFNLTPDFRPGRRQAQSCAGPSHGIWASARPLSQTWSRGRLGRRVLMALAS